MASNPVTNQKIWTKGGDIELIDSDDDLEKVVIYITEAQDLMGRVKRQKHLLTCYFVSDTDGIPLTPAVLR